MASSSDYTALITSEHADKPNFVALVAAVAGAMADANNAVRALDAAFDLDTAIGVQLDAVGLWIGFSRYISTPLNVYFSLDIAGLGFDQGSWQGPFDGSQGLTRLDDATYRTMLRVKIGANHWDSTMPSFLSIASQIFAGTGTLLFGSDNQDMTMSVYVGGTPAPAVLLALLKNSYSALKPEGVGAFYYKPSVDSMPFFGFDIQTSNVAGFDAGAWSIPL